MSATPDRLRVRLVGLMTLIGDALLRSAEKLNNAMLRPARKVACAKVIALRQRRLSGEP